MKINETRRHLAIGQENSRRAAHAALFVGLHVNQTSVNAALDGLRGTVDGLRGAVKRQRKTAGKARGAQIKTQAAANDATIQKHLNTWIISDELKEAYASGAAYVEAKTELPRRTIQRRIKALSPRQ